MIILASASPRRAELLTRAKIPFKVIVSPAHEPERKPKSVPTELWPIFLAYLKATAVQSHISNLKSQIKNPTILAADTIVVLGTRILNKARDRSHARRILSALNHKTHRIITGICLVRGNKIRLSAATATCKIHFTPKQLTAYLNSNLWQGKAGAYGIQDGPNHRDPFVTLLDGDINTVIGLPLALVKKELARLAKD